MSKEFNAIRLVVTGDKKETQVNPLWLNIHNETGCGTIAVSEQHERLRVGEARQRARERAPHGRVATVDDVAR